MHSLMNARQEMFDNVYWHHTNRACMAMLLRAVPVRQGPDAVIIKLTSTLRFLALFEGVSLGTSGSVSARPSALMPLASPSRAANTLLTAKARSSDKCQLDGKRSVLIGILSV